MASFRSRSPGRGFRAESFFWGIALAAMFVLLGSNALYGSEGRWAEGLREMLISGNFITPTLNWQPCADQSLFGCWFGYPVARLFGLHEFSLRFPSALAALAGLLGTRMLAAALFDRRVCCCAGWMLLGSYGFLFWGRMTADDIFGMTIAVWMILLVCRQQERPRTFLLPLSVFLLMALGVLFKGFGSLLVPVAMALPFLEPRRRWKELGESHLLAAFLTAVLLIAGMLLAAAFLSRTPAQGVRQGLLSWFSMRGNSLLHRILSPRGSWGSYLEYWVHLPRLLLPWTLLAVVSCAGLLRHWKELPEPLKKLFTGIGIALILLGVLPHKRWYHLLPLVPFVLICTSCGFFSDFGEKSWNHGCEKFMRCLFLIASSLGVATLVALPLWDRLLNMTPPMLLTAALPVFGAAALLVLGLHSGEEKFWEHLTGLPAPWSRTVLAGTLLTVGMLCVIFPATGTFRTEKPFFLALKQEMGKRNCRQLLYFRKNPGADASFYLELPCAMQEIRNGLELEHFTGSGAVVALIAPRGKKDLLARNMKQRFPGFDPEKPDCAEEVTVRFDGKPSLPDENDWVAWFLSSGNRIKITK